MLTRLHEAGNDKKLMASLLLLTSINGKTVHYFAVALARDGSHGKREKGTYALFSGTDQRPQVTPPFQLRNPCIAKTFWKVSISINGIYQKLRFRVEPSSLTGMDSTT